MALAGLRQGQAHLKPAQGGKFQPYISWKDGDAKTIAFTTPADEIAKIRIHNFVKIPDDSERGYHFETFMCRKDPAWAEESGNKCKLCDIIGHKAKEQHVAIAVELDPIIKPGTSQISELRPLVRKFKRQDGTEGEAVQWGLVIQGFKNFFNYFAAYQSKFGDITNVAFDVTRMGSDQTTSYPVIPVQTVPLPDLSSYDIPLLVDVLENLGSEEKYARDLHGAEEIDQSSQFDTTISGPEEQQSGHVRSKFEELKSSLPAGDLEAYSAA